MNVTNGTVYDTDDIVKLVKLAKNETNVDYERIGLKIRYLNDLYDGKHARLITGGYYSTKPIELAILRPSKIQVNALMWLAQSADADVLTVPKVVLDDVVRAMGMNRWGWVDSSTERALLEMAAKRGLQLRMHNKAKGRKAFTLENIRQQLKDKEATVYHTERKLRNAEYNVQYYKKRLADARKAIGPAKKRLEAAEKRLAKDKTK